LTKDKTKDSEYTLEDLFDPKTKEARKEGLIFRSSVRCKLVLTLNNLFKTNKTVTIYMVGGIMDRDYEQTRRYMIEFVRRFELLNSKIVRTQKQRGTIVEYEPRFDKNSSESRIETLAKKIMKENPELIERGK
jgi:hypothetical protein